MSAPLSPIRLKAVITIDFDAENYLSAAQFQSELEKEIEAIRTDFPAAEVYLRERRPRGDSWRSRRPVGVRSGRVNRYE